MLYVILKKNKYCYVNLYSFFSGGLPLKQHLNSEL